MHFNMNSSPMDGNLIYITKNRLKSILFEYYLDIHS